MAACSKKQRERFLLDRFFERQRISPTCIQKSEAPDFLIDLQGRRVGIEVTELFIRPRSKKSETDPPIGEGPSLQELESTTNRIVSKAQQIYFAANNPPVMLTIWSSDQITLDKTKGYQIAELIADLIQSLNLQNSQVFHWRSSEAEIEHPLSGFVDLIHAEGVPEPRFARWTVARPGLVAPLTGKHLQNSIDKKAQKINSYQKNAEETWLLIVADHTQPSQMFFVAQGFSLDSVTSPFAKTFFYNYAAEEVIDLTKSMKPVK
jgi:hypothetical protein